MANKEEIDEFFTLVKNYKKTHKISAKDISTMLMQVLEYYYSVVDEDSIINTSEQNNALTQLYDILEKHTIEFLKAHPSLVKHVEDIQKDIVDNSNWICKKVFPSVTFGFSMEDVLEKVYDRPHNIDINCGFRIGHKNLSIF